MNQARKLSDVSLLIASVLALSGLDIPALLDTRPECAKISGGDTLTFLESVDPGGRLMWRRRLAHGLSADEAAFVRTRLEELKAAEAV